VHVGVHPLAGFDRLLHYSVPEDLREGLRVGSLVRVPVRRQLHLGVVGEIGSPDDFPAERLKPVAQLVYPFPALTPDLVALARWMGAYYAAPLDAVIEAMLPAAVRRGANLKLERLLGLGERLPPAELARLGRRAPQQARLYRFLEGQPGPQPRALVLERLGVGPSAAAALVRRGALREESRRIVREAYADDWGEGEAVAARPLDVNPDQAAASAVLARAAAAGRFGTFLLHGVTGSGKTEVYLRAVDAALRAGGGVIYLVPEVALTPQTVARLRGRLAAIAPAHRCVVWHSHLGEGERLDGWLALAAGEARVVVGARSAIFAPIRDLRLVVVDEEHEPAYKQEETPRYHGRDVAVMRAKLAGALAVLGSATPSLESYANAGAGKYRLLALPRRVDERRLPDLDIVDMRVELTRQRQFAALSRRLVDAMQDRFARKEQTILFINRRGYSSSLLCPKCGQVETCPHCSIALTYHRVGEILRCHLCGEERPAPARCTQCGAPDIRWRGLGTQRVEEAVRRVLPRARLARLDADTMSGRHRFRQILGDFRRGRIDILVGTQMIAKGLDFPNVTLVGLVDADLSLHVPDFRASERTFQLLVQVAGRAGRGDRAGEVVVQTFTPQAGPIQFSRHADYAGFAAEELELRRKFGYPPARHLIHQLWRGPNPDKLKFFAEQWARRARETLGPGVEIRGPVPAPIEKIKDEYRRQVWYFTAAAAPAVERLLGLRREFPCPDDVTETLDVDPVNLM
jgi:primosomal protein N' (replication factor Y) (superfamily II helicase)